MQRSAKVIASVIVMGVLVAACGSSSSPSKSAGDSSSASSEVLGSKNPATGTPVKIGLINAEDSATFNSVESGDAAVATAKYANEYLGGLGGHPIEIVRCADKSDSTSAVACANQMVEEKVAVVVKGIVAFGDQIVPIVAGAHIPYVGNSGASLGELTSDDAFFWSGGALGVLGAEAQYAKEEGFKTVNFFVVDVPAATGSLQAIGKPVFDKAGVEITVTPVPAGTADATSIVTAGLAKHPDAVSVVGDPTLCQSLLSALVTAGSKLPTLLLKTCIDQQVIDAVGAEVIEGLKGAAVFDTAEGESSHHEAELFRAVMAKYLPKDKSATAKAATAEAGYQGMLGLVRAVNAGHLTGEPTPANITAAIKEAKNVPLPAGHGIMYSCDKPSVPNPLLKAILCSAGGVVGTLDGTELTHYRVVDPTALFSS